MSTVHESAITAEHYAKAREVALVAMTGLGAFAVSLLLGRGVRALGALPMFLPSLIVALPRCYILLSLRSYTRSFGALTAAGIVEALCLFGCGSISPVALIVPVLSALLADALWTLLSAKTGRRVALAISGGVLATTRVAGAILLWGVLWHPGDANTAVPPTQVLALVIGGNFVLGTIAGVAAAKTWMKSARDRRVK